MKTTGKPLLDAALGIRQEKPPVWIMRQAGRYLPEYRATREKAGGFLNLCYTPEYAIEVTLQPLRRFDLDAAILFSDILVIPDALGQKVGFATGEGPVLEPITVEGIDALDVDGFLNRLSPVFEALSGIKSQLAADKTMIGFCGAPWTVATYMIGGKGSADQAKARQFALTQPEAFKKLIDVLVEVSAQYLVKQLRSGADMVQIFESWATNLDEHQFMAYVVGPNKRIVEKVRAEIPDAVITGFPRAAAGMIAEYVAQTNVNVVGIDYSTPIDFVNKYIPETVTVQGNLDPLRLVAGGQQMEDRVREIVKGFAHRPHIFNLGHGIVPQTPIENVQRLIEVIKE